MKSSFYNIVINNINENKESIIFNTVSGAIVKLNETDYYNLSNNIFTNINIDKVNYLLDKGIVVEEKKNELKQLIEVNNDNISTTKTLTYVIAPSSNCQLGCDYCGQKHTSNRLDESKERLLLIRIYDLLKLYNYESLAISWYGGEPLIGLESIKRILNDLKQKKN